MTAAGQALAELVAAMRALRASDGPAAAVARLAEPCRRLASRRDWLEPRFFAADPARGFGIVSLHEEPDHSLSVVVAALLPGRGLPPHNHKTWALQAGLTGTQVSVAWRRLDGEAHGGRVALEPGARLRLGPGDLATFLPEDIHSVENDGDEVALSLNLYGLAYAVAGASRFDPEAGTERPLLS